MIDGVKAKPIVRPTPRRRVSVVVVRPNKMNTPEVVISEDFYVESAATGRFRRHYPSEDNGSRRGWRLSTAHHNDNLRGEIDNETLTRFAFISFLFLQGLLSGLSLSSFYEAFISRSRLDFIVQYSARAVETRRYFFIGITLSATGSLCLLNGDISTQLADVWKGKNTLSSITKSNLSLVMVYFFALIVTLLCSFVDVKISKMAMDININNISGASLESIINEWRALAVSRSILCILGWLVSCYRFVVARSNDQREE